MDEPPGGRGCAPQTDSQKHAFSGSFKKVALVSAPANSFNDFEKKYFGGFPGTSSSGLQGAFKRAPNPTKTNQYFEDLGSPWMSLAAPSGRSDRPQRSRVKQLEF